MFGIAYVLVCSAIIGHCSHGRRTRWDSEQQGDTSPSSFEASSYPKLASLSSLLWSQAPLLRDHHLQARRPQYLNFANSHRIAEKSPRVHAGVLMMAKTKKKKTAAQVAALEALESFEAQSAGAVPDDIMAPVAPAKKKKKKNQKSAAAEAALAQLEALEAAGDSVPADIMAPVTPAKKKKKKNKKSAAAEAALEQLEALEAAGDVLPPTPEPPGKKSQKKKAKSEEVEAALEKAEALEVPSETSKIEIVQEAEEELTKEEQVRRASPKAKVRITESSQPGFVSLRMDKISKYIGNQEVLKDASWEVRTGDRVGLVGANGCGKSTQLRILSGEVEPTSGEIVKSSSRLRVSVFKQEFIDDIDPKRTLTEELYSVFGRGVEVLREISEAEEELNSPEVQEDPEKMQDVLDRLADLQREAESADTSRFESQVERVVNQMGFTLEDRNALVETFSGGWKMRIGLGKILLQDPNILLLDEPTNHLDLETVEWMENFLSEQKLPMVIVSHDREFLDRVCTKIVETIDGVTYSYDGDYSTFLEQKNVRWESWQAAYDAQQKKIKADRSWIQKNKQNEQVKAQVKSRQVELDKLLASKDYVERPPNKAKRFFFRFPTPPRKINDFIVRMEGVCHGYDGNTLFRDVGLEMEPSDRIAFIGPNGAGKSTLFRLILGEEEPNDGFVALKENLDISYYAQQTTNSLDLDDTVLGVLEKVNTELDQTELRALLGRFLFKGDDVHKKIGSLSGGEKARVALCRMMLKPASLLVLDEPTNHLDIPAKEILEEALQHYGGSVLLISHDRYFLSKVATAICAFENKEMEIYDGDYSEYLRSQPEYRQKIKDRFKKGVSREIEQAKVLYVEEETQQKKKKNFGGKGGPSGNLNKGVKNAKRQTKR